MKHIEIIKYFEKWSPKSLAYDWDNVGLQIGDLNDDTKNVLITLDVMENVIDEAISKNANLIIAHHPLLFNPLNEIDTSSSNGKLIQKIIKHDITIYAAHTNFDIANGGMNDALAERLGLNDIESFINTSSESLYKFIVYTPESHVETLRSTFDEAGAGSMGNYSHCTFSTEGLGSFKPEDNANPYIGKINELEFVNEVKLETIVSENKLSQLIEAAKKAHPYEEMAYDCFLLQQKGQAYSLGRIGLLDQAIPLSEAIDLIKEKLKLKDFKYIGEENQMVQKLAILGGSGEKFIPSALQANVDLYISGDFTFHPAQIAMQNGLAIADVGHYIEAIFKEVVSQKLKRQFPSIDIMMSEVNTNPFKFTS